MKSKFSLSEEEKAELRERRVNHIAGLSMAYQLGLYIGEYIIDRFLPTLSVDSLQTKTNISVTAAEGDECRRLEEVWFKLAQSTNDSTGDSKEWKDLREYREMLEAKYLPKEVECIIKPLNIKDEDVEEFKKGISTALWDSDLCHYSTKHEDIVISHDSGMFFSKITLKKD